MGVSKKEISPYPIDASLSVIGGRWKGTILWRLLGGPMRTNELRKSIPQITERMLLRHLSELTEAGILGRHQEQGPPLRVRYSLTPYGWTLVPVLEVLCSWGREHLKRGFLPDPHCKAVPSSCRERDAAIAGLASSTNTAAQCRVDFHNPSFTTFVA